MARSHQRTNTATQRTRIEPKLAATWLIRTKLNEQWPYLEKNSTLSRPCLNHVWTLSGPCLDLV
eukprot:11032464-Lingulodinium_polyedra.AAC.1